MPKIIPFDDEVEKVKGKGFHYRGEEYIHHSDIHYNESAFISISLEQLVSLGILFLTLLVSFYFYWKETLIVFIFVIILLYFLDLLFNLYLVIRSLIKSPEIKISKGELDTLNDESLPIYTILCPLYKEWKVIPQFISGIKEINYPKKKLQVLLLLEENDTQTIREINKTSLPSYFEVVIVPHSNPKTKPKACNYGLMKSKGEYVVIYDAEDIPEKDQLKKAYLAFQKVDPKTICIQAKLNFYNPHQNIITKVFTAEYLLWFDLVLTGLQAISAPIPLGGTSNHFKRSTLEKLSGWDSFNVTEDCDLGIRLVRNGYKTAIIDSITHEEANSQISNWIKQRTRWNKGYMQTYFVHMRKPLNFILKTRNLSFLTFQLVVGGKIFSMLVNPLMWFITISYFILKPLYGDFIDQFFPTPVLYMGVTSLIFGNFLYFYYYMIGCVKSRHEDLVKYMFLVPVYWLFMSYSAWLAAYELVMKPHYWSKTKHGLHLNTA